MPSYAFRPPPSGLHAKLIREARELSPYTVRAMPGRPGYVRVANWLANERTVWSGHRDLMPAEYRFARDPHNVLDRPDSSD